MAVAGDGPNAAIVLNDLLRDMMEIELDETGKVAAHGALMAAYRWTQTGKG